MPVSHTPTSVAKELFKNHLSNDTCYGRGGQALYVDFEQVVMDKLPFLDIFCRGFTPENIYLKRVISQSTLVVGEAYHDLHCTMDKVILLTRDRLENKDTPSLSSIATIIFTIVELIKLNRTAWWCKYNHSHQKRIQQYTAKPITVAARHLLLQQLPEDMVNEIMSYEDTPTLFEEIAHPNGITFDDILNVKELPWDWAAEQINNFGGEKGIWGSEKHIENVCRGVQYWKHSWEGLVAGDEGNFAESNSPDTTYTLQMFKEELQEELRWSENESKTTEGRPFLPWRDEREHPRATYLAWSHSRRPYHSPGEPNTTQRIIAFNHLTYFLYWAIQYKARDDYEQTVGMTGLTEGERILSPQTPDAKTVPIYRKRYQFLYAYQQTVFRENRYEWFMRSKSRPYYYKEYSINPGKPPHHFNTTNPQQKCCIQRNKSVKYYTDKAKDINDQKHVDRMLPHLHQYNLLSIIKNGGHQYTLVSIIKSNRMTLLWTSIYATFAGFADYMDQGPHRGGSASCWKHLAQRLGIPGRSKLLTSAKRPELKMLIKNKVFELYQHH